jgi:predicted lipid-binding transport protein (Tim44 family)
VSQLVVNGASQGAGLAGALAGGAIGTMVFGPVGTLFGAIIGLYSFFSIVFLVVFLTNAVFYRRFNSWHGYIEAYQ